MKRNNIVLFMFINALVLIFHGVVLTQGGSAKTFDIGIATPLTGPAAHLGTMIKNGILMAI